MSSSTMLTKVFVCEMQVVFSTVLFGLSFIGMRKATDDLASPITYNAWRFIVSTVVIAMSRNRMKATMHTDVADESPEDISCLIKAKSHFPTMSQKQFDLIVWGGLSGIFNFLISTFQQYGIVTVSAGKAAFINGLFVVVIPLLEYFLPCYESSMGLLTWFAVLLSGVGTYLLSDPHSSDGFGMGEFLLILGMLSCCMGILVSDAGTQRVDCIDLTVIELGVTAVLSTIISIYQEPHMWEWPLLAVQVGWPMIVCVGCTEGFGYLFGTLGQMHIPPHRASMLFGLEGVMTTVMAYFMLDEVLSLREMVGCALMLLGTMIHTVPAEIEEASETAGDTAASERQGILGSRSDPSCGLRTRGHSMDVSRRPRGQSMDVVHLHPMIRAHSPFRPPIAHTVPTYGTADHA